MGFYHGSIDASPVFARQHRHQMNRWMNFSQFQLDTRRLFNLEKIEEKFIYLWSVCISFR